MTVNTVIVDGFSGRPRRAGVTADGELLVATRAESAASLAQTGNLDLLARQYAYTAKLQNASSSTDMRVDGSTTPVEFYIGSDADRVIYIDLFRIVIACTQMSLAGSEGARFGPYASGLTNGLLVQTSQGGVNINVWQDPLQRLIEFTYYTDLITNIAGAYGAGVDLTTVTYYFNKPVVIVPSSPDKFKITVQDDLSDPAFSEMLALVSGYQESTE